MQEPLKLWGGCLETSTDLGLTHIPLYSTLPELFHFLSENYVLV